MPDSMKCPALLIVLVCFFHPVTASSAYPEVTVKPILEESFENALPELQTAQAGFSRDTTHANSGHASLLVQPVAGKTGGAYISLKDRLEPGRSYEFSAAVRLLGKGTASLYVSAAKGKSRRALSSVKVAETDKWVVVQGVLGPDAWAEGESDPLLAMVTDCPTCFDDVVVREVKTAIPPLIGWPKTMAKLVALADASPTALTTTKDSMIYAVAGAMAEDLGDPVVVRPEGLTAQIGADGALVFAFDLAERAKVGGQVALIHGPDLRPGLRAYVLIDSTVVGAPMVRAAPWSNLGGMVNNPAPYLTGKKPPESFLLADCVLEAGRHYLKIVGPHSRDAGKFIELVLRATPAPEKELYRFAFLTDIHLGEGRAEWMNLKLRQEVGLVLKDTLERLRRESVDFAFFGGDMVDTGTADQIRRLDDIVQAAGLKVYGVMGNHDTFQPTSRADLRALGSHLLPDGETAYAFTKGPLRFVVLDRAYWKNKHGPISDHMIENESITYTMNPAGVDWLKKTLGEDKRTPTVVLSHFPFFARPEVSTSGYEMVSWVVPDDSARVIAKSPNIFAALNGHTHWNQIGTNDGIAWVQNAAFGEWPAMYRVFRVYADRLEWETRVVDNLGFLRQSILPKKGVSWMISTGEGDLVGQIKYKQH